MKDLAKGGRDKEERVLVNAGWVVTARFTRPGRGISLLFKRRECFLKGHGEHSFDAVRSLIYSFGHAGKPIQDFLDELG